MSSAAAEPVSNSPLLQLPAELRNRIYELAIEGRPRIASLRTCDMYDTTMRHTMRFTAEYDASEPALLAVCHSIRREAKGMLYTKHSRKAVLFACGCDESEMIHWEDQLLRRFSRSETMNSAVSVETGPPNLGTWERAICWLRNAEVDFLNLHGGVENQGSKSEEVWIFCAVAQVSRNPSRKPWDLVEDKFSYINYLLHTIQPSSRKDDWKQM